MSKVTMYVDEHFYEELRKRAKGEDRSISWVLKKATESYLGMKIQNEEKPKVDRKESQRAVMAAQAEAYETKPVKRKQRARRVFLLKGDCPLETCGLRAVPGHGHYADEMTLEDWLVINRNKEQAEEEWWEEKPAVDDEDMDLEGDDGEEDKSAEFTELEEDEE